MAAGASLLSIAPHLTLNSCDIFHVNGGGPTSLCENTKVITNFEQGEITIEIKFHEPHIHKKRIKVKDNLKKEFQTVKICNTGSINLPGQPEIPYFGLLVHMPEYLLFENPKLEDREDTISYGDIPIYPAQSDAQDNLRYLKNYSQNADYSEKVYYKFPTGSTIPVGETITLEEEGVISRYPTNLFEWVGPYYIGSSRFFVLGIMPFYFVGNILVDRRIAVAWRMRSKFSFKIKKIRAGKQISTDHFLDTPFLPIEYDKLPKHDRIIDPWCNLEEFRKILPDQKVYNTDLYRLIGPDLIIFYQVTSEFSDKMFLSCQRLLDHKINHGFPNAVMVSVDNHKALDSDDKLKEKVIEIIRANENTVGPGKFEIWRLKSIILLGDIQGIENIDLFQAQYLQLDDDYKDGNSKRNFYSDFCVSTPRNAFQVKDRWPDIAIGRIPVKSIAEAKLVIDNIIDYETHSYNIFKKLTLSSYFQARGPGSQKIDRKAEVIEATKDYLQCVEEIRLGLDHSITNKVEMVYQTEMPDIPLSGHKYRDGTKLDDTIKFLEACEAKEKIQEAFRTGGQFIVHRDHGWMDGWAHPNFKITDTWTVQIDPDCVCKDRKPSIVFNINCLSGRFTGELFAGCEDDLTSDTCYKLPKPENDCFSEVLLKGTLLPDGSRLNLKCPAVIASTEVSPSFENDWLLKIMFDLIYGGILTDKPKKEIEMGKQTIGSILNTAKMLLRAYQGDRGMHMHENIAFHVLGDPTLKV